MTASLAPLAWPIESELAALLAALGPRLLRLAHRYTRDAEASADVVQNACEKVLRHRTGFRGDARVSTWIHRIVVNEALMWLRTEKRRGRRSAPFDPVAAAEWRDPSPSALEGLLGHERDLRMQHALAALPHEEQDLLRCCVMEGEDHATFGARRGLAAAAVKSRAYRARRRLEDVLKDASAVEGDAALST